MLDDAPTLALAHAADLQSLRRSEEAAARNGSLGGQTAALDFWKCKDQWLSTWDGENSALRVSSVQVYQ